MASIIIIFVIGLPLYLILGSLIDCALFDEDNYIDIIIWPIVLLCMVIARIVYWFKSFMKGQIK